MKCTFNLKKHLVIALSSFGFALALTSCTKISDEIVLQKIKLATEPSDLFHTICVGTKADSAQINRLALSQQWTEQPISQEPNTKTPTKMFNVSLNNATFQVGMAQGYDPDVGHTIEVCTLSYGGTQEPAFVQNVISKSGLLRVAQNNQIRKGRRSDAIILSETGREDADSFIVQPVEVNTFGLRTVMAFAIRPSK